MIWLCSLYIYFWKKYFFDIIELNIPIVVWHLGGEPCDCSHSNIAKVIQASRTESKI